MSDVHTYVRRRQDACDLWAVRFPSTLPAKMEAAFLREQEEGGNAPAEREFSTGLYVRQLPVS